MSLHAMFPAPHFRSMEDLTNHPVRCVPRIQKGICKVRECLATLLCIRSCSLLEVGRVSRIVRRPKEQIPQSFSVTNSKDDRNQQQHTEQ